MGAPLMQTEAWLHQASLGWLMLVQVMIVAPYLSTHPSWLLIALGLGLYWQWRAWRSGMRPLRRGLRLSILLLGLAGLYGSGYVRYDMDAAVAVVLLGFVLKTVEVHQRRDLQMLLMVGLFLTAAQLLYSQTLLRMATVALTVLVWGATLISAESGSQAQCKRPLQQALLLMLLSLPLMLILFVGMPRLPPLWEVPHSSQASTGLNDQVTPGDIARLVKSPQQAFRATFEHNRPSAGQMYWRAQVMTQFDGRSWHNRQVPQRRYRETPSESGELFAYQVMLEAHQQHWLHSLDVPVDYERSVAQLQADYRLRAHQPVRSTLAYRLVSQALPKAQQGLSASQRQQLIALPPASHPRLQQWSRQLRQHLPSDSAMVAAVLAHIEQQPFFYTLTPPLLPAQHSMDAFWFDHQQGFCTSYASAFLISMRAVDIPARMVTGYLGGQWNAQGHYWVVRQMDAHAWAEVWLAGQGWVRVDPTAAVAPQRVLDDLSQVFADQPDMANQLTGALSSIGLLARVQLWQDNLEFQWQRWVVSFDESQRQGLLHSLIGSSAYWQTGLWLLGSFVAVALLWGWVLGGWRYRQREKQSDALKGLQRLEAYMRRHHLPRGPAETVTDYCERLAQRWPQARGHLQAFARGFNQSYYTPAPDLVQAQQPLLARVQSIIRLCRTKP